MYVLVLHGPNLGALGRREAEHYGTHSLAEIDTALVARGLAMGARVECRQSNHEGVLIDWLLDAGLGGDPADAIVLNAGGYTHTSVAIRDAVVACGRPVVEAHLSNVAAREPFRNTSLLTPVARGLICGFGPDSYALALDAAIALARRQRCGSGLLFGTEAAGAEPPAVSMADPAAALDPVR